MGLLKRGQAALIARQQVAATTGEPLTYTRKVGGAVDLTDMAWTGRTQFRRTGGDTVNAAVVYGDRDYLIPVAALKINGVGFEPARGDRIIEVVDGVALVFEIVTPAAQGEPEWRFSDESRTVYRVHTKHQKQVS